MHTRPPLFNEDNLSVEAVFDALQDRLPPRAERTARYSELDFFDTKSLKETLDRRGLVVVDYTNFWLRKQDRLGDFFTVWSLGFFLAQIPLMLVGHVLGLFGSGSAGEALSLLGGGLVGGLCISLRYSTRLPTMADHSVVLIDGETRQLIHACRVVNDKPVGRVVRVPLSELGITLSWGQIDDRVPSHVAVYLGLNPASRHGGARPPNLFIASVDDVGYPGPAPAALATQAEDFARILGASYLGLVSE